MAILKPEQLSSGSYSISGSFSGSFFGDGSNLVNLPIPQIDTGSFVLTSSFNAFTGSYNTGSFTGSFTGDGSGLTGIVSASYAETASYAVSASYEINYETSSSYADTASLAEFALTASYVQNAQTASYVLNAISSSYALSASFAPSTPAFPFTGSALITGSLGVTGSFSVSNNTSNILIVSSSGLSTFTSPTQLSGNLTTSPLITLNQSLQSFGNSSVMLRLVETSINNSFSVALYKRSGTNETHLLTGGAGSGTNTERTFIAVTGTNTDGAGSLYINKANTNIGYGVTGGDGARLDIKAQGALSTDIALRVRNSADAITNFSVDGLGYINTRINGTNFTRTLIIGGGNINNKVDASSYDDCVLVGFNNTVAGYAQVNIGNGNNLSTGLGQGVVVGLNNATVSEITLGYNNSGRGVKIGRDNSLSVLNGQGANSFIIGNYITVTNSSANNNTIFFGSRTSSGTAYTSMHENNLGIGGVVPTLSNYDLNARGVFYTQTGTAPTTLAADTFGMYSADIIAGNAVPHFRTENGSVIKLYQQSAVTSSQGLADVLTNVGLLSGSSVISNTVPSGPFGIANSSGSYTYYTTFSASIAAATSGQTVEMFADVIETASIEITLKNGVNINGNGHTYTLNNSGTIHALRVPITVDTTCNVLNLNVIRTGSTATITDNSALILGTNGTGTINCAGSTFRNLGSGCGILFNTNSGHEVNYATAYATTTWGAIGIFTSYGAKLNNSIGYGTSGGIGIRCHNGGDIQNCTGVSDSSYGIYGLAGNQSNSVGVSATGNGFFAAATAFNCVGRSTSGIGIEAQNGTNIVGCIGISVSGRGLTTQNAIIYNCTGISSSSSGMSLAGTSKAYNITAKSSTSYALWGTLTSCPIYGGTIVCDWNNAAGYGIRGNGGNISNTIINCTFNLSNASAPYLFNDGTAQAITMRGNTYQGGAVFNANLTQATVATQDNQGNIFL